MSKTEFLTETRRWHGITKDGFYPIPQNSYRDMKIVLGVNGGGWAWHKRLRKIAFRVNEK